MEEDAIVRRGALVWLLILVGVSGALVGSAPARDVARQTNPTFKLVPFPKKECTAPKVIVGRACVDKSNQVLTPDWKYSDGSATLSPTGWKSSYSWTVPATIPPAGASIKMSLQTGSVTVGSICPGIGARGSFPLKKPGETDLNICAQQGGSASGSKTLTVVPPSSGPGYLLIGLGDGPSFTYKYEAQKPAPKACRRASSVGSRTDLEPPFVVAWSFFHDGVPESGESPTLLASTTSGSGQLTICNPFKTSVLAAKSVAKNVEHTDVHVFPFTGDKRREHLELDVPRGVYSRYDKGLRKVTLEIVVKSSTDKECPRGRKGRLIVDKTPSFTTDGGSTIVLRLCGANHKHVFYTPKTSVRTSIAERPG
jgi:hypothetical protein